MGARQSKRSVDITTTPKKGDAEAGSAPEGKLEAIADVDVKTLTNGTVHTDIEFADKDEEVKETDDKEKENAEPVENIKENGLPEEEKEKESEPSPVTEEAPVGDQNTESTSSPVAEENGGESTSKAEETPDSKKKEKKKKKWSFRGISFSKKDKPKLNKDAEKNGEAKENIAEEKTEDSTSPATEATEAPKSEESPTGDEGTSQPTIANGNATKEEAEDKPAEKITEKADELKPCGGDTKTPEPVNEQPVESVPLPTEEAKPVEPKLEEPKVDVEPKPVVDTPAPVEDTKEVRTEDISPPLPESNPPTQIITETCKADTLPNEQSSKAEQDMQPPAVPEEKQSIKDETVLPEISSGPIIESNESKTKDSISNQIIVTDQSPKDSIDNKPESDIQISEDLSSKTVTDLSNHSVEKVDTNVCPIKNDEVHSPVSVLSPTLEPNSNLAENNKDHEIPNESNLVNLADLNTNITNEETISRTHVENTIPVPNLSQGDVSTQSLQADVLTEIPSDNSPVKEQVSETVANADSYPDLSTESLPSLPEPISESLPEPISLPPVDSVPDPITDDCLPEPPPAPKPIPNHNNLNGCTEIPILTNGNSNGLAITPPTDEMPPLSPTGLKKQVLNELPVGNPIESSQNDATANNDSSPATVEE